MQSCRSALDLDLISLAPELAVFLQVQQSTDHTEQIRTKQVQACLVLGPVTILYPRCKYSLVLARVDLHLQTFIRLSMF